MAFSEFFEEKRKGIFREASLPVFGRQDVGITPGGVMDQFAFDCGNALLGNPENAPALEILVPPVLIAKKRLYFSIMGAPFIDPRLKVNASSTFLEHGIVHVANPEAEFHFGSRKSGLRSYLCFRTARDNVLDKSMVGRKMGEPEETRSWSDSEGLVRVIEGPEFQFLKNRDDFFITSWSVSKDTSDMGMRLESPVTLTVELKNMISEAVTNGTVQVTPAGPIVLLKYRQTVGGYPRVFSVISADVDLLAQYVPGQKIRFRKISIEEAWRAAHEKRAYIVSLRRRFSAF
jgi:allophanate hydrolase subunit 2